MRNVLLLGLAGGGAYYAYRAGMLPQLGPIVDRVSEMVRPPAQFLPQEQWGRGDAAKAGYSAAVKDASGGRVLPILGPKETVAVNAFEAMLRQNRNDLSGWARENMGWAAAICRVENASRNPKTSGDNGTSHGVLQVKVATAETCRRAGYTKYPATKETLLTYQGGIYFGTAEMERLSKINGNLDWIIQAYNGGAGFQQMPEKYQKDRAAYLAKVKKAFVQLYGGTMA